MKLLIKSILILASIFFTTFLIFKFLGIFSIEDIKNIFETINIGLPMDLIAVDLKEALDALSEVTSEISSEDVLDHIFSNFCVGK